MALTNLHDIAKIKTEWTNLADLIKKYPIIDSGIFTRGSFSISSTVDITSYDLTDAEVFADGRLIGRAADMRMNYNHDGTRTVEGRIVSNDSR